MKAESAVLSKKPLTLLFKCETAFMERVHFIGN